ncbi:hypothetical protein EDC39_11012 [Geothermobacter ehrlichii]|uniref:Uncharacterized protein n=1 Tax=Geothermobacter ehrlichii TaxID=213224 RepID=A0A5D3WIM9_9BACT|nr:hypothetical protein [Geothermobacter ehrlichii]TYO97472.1 hypothetical protein EDC39_11012 [Geothermobacter ehrlichii]
MNRKDYRELCDLAAAGEHRIVINLDNHTQGEVRSCHHDYFNVRVGRGWEVWNRKDCEMSLMLHESAGQSEPSIDFQI